MSQQEYGVVYSPFSEEKRKNGATFDIAPLSDEHFDALGVEFIRVTWVDLINNVRYSVVPRDYFRRLLDSPRPGVAIAVATLGLVGLQLAPGFTGTGEYLYVLDVRTFRLCPYAPGHASVMGFFQPKTPPPSAGPNIAIAICPRALLQRIVDIAREEAGLRILVGFESEFILLKRDALPEIVPVNDADFSVSSKMPAGSVEALVMEEIARDLKIAGIELQMYHAEAAPGQYEVVTGPLEPLEAADALVSTRETIYNVAVKHGLRATFAPRLSPTYTGSAAHTNISLHEIPTSRATAGRAEITARGGSAQHGILTPAEQSFLSGMLEHVPALCALTLPTAASYARVADGAWSGGTYAVWGTDNREAAVRVTGPRVRGRSRFEVRFVDGTACPHLVLAGLLTAGVGAVRAGRALRTGDCEKAVVFMSEEEKRAAGVCDARGEVVVGRLARTIGQARRNLQDDAELRAMLGEEFVERYLAVNETLEKCLQLDTEADTMLKLVQFY